MITLPTDVYARAPIRGPSATFNAIDEVLALEEELAGFDGDTALSTRTPLRHHFLVDFRASEEDRKKFYMYVGEQFVGLRPDNTTDLTDPMKLKKLWGIWHEIGHTHQQGSWTWDGLAEISCNLFSLYVQERMGVKSRLDTAEADGTTPYSKVMRYIDNGTVSYQTESDEYNDYFVKLVMFDQLRQTYGWKLFSRLFRHYRLHFLPSSAIEQKKVDTFAVTLSSLSETDLRPFFSAWRLRISSEADQKIASLKLRFSVEERGLDLTNIRQGKISNHRISTDTEE